MKTPVRILHIDTDEHVSDLVKTILEADRLACSVTRVETRSEFLHALKQDRFDVILSECELPSFDGHVALTIVTRKYPHIPFVFFTDKNDDDAVVECLRHGAQDFLAKRNITRLSLVVGRVLQEAEDRLERQRAEEALKMSQEYAQNLVNSSLDMIISVDMNRRIVEFNKAAEEAFGYHRDEVIGKHVDLLYARPRQGLRIHKATVLSGKCVEEVQNVRKNGEFFTSWLSASILKNSHGELTGVMGVARDITENKRTNEQLREHAALLDVAQDAIFIHDLPGKILYWNKSAERVYLWQASEAVGQNVHTLLHADVAQQIEEHRKTCLHSGQWRGEMRQKTKSGKEVIVESRWTLVRNSENVPRSILVVNTDITEKKQLELQFLRTQRMESIGTLAGGIAHDLNNVLTPIMSGLQILHRRISDEQSHRLLATLEASARRGTDIVKQVLTFARGAEGERSIIQPKHLVREIEKIARETFPKSIHLSQSTAKDLWTVNGDPTQLHQVLLNLCVNSRDAMPNGGTLNLNAENVVLDENYSRMDVEAKPGPYVVLTVADTGSGIAPAILDKIFEPFFTTKDPDKGTGLGLATVLGLVKHHKGFLNVYSEMGKGTTFKVYLPASDAEEVVKRDEVVHRFEEFAGRGKTVLMVDDEDSILEVTKETLTTCGYAVMTANDGTEAVALMADNKGKVDVVVTDMMMPFLDGPSTIRALRKISPGVKIIASSGLGNDSRIAEVESLHVEAFLTKPYTAETLLTTLQDVLSGKSTGVAARQPSTKEELSNSFVGGFKSGKGGFTFK